MAAIFFFHPLLELKDFTSLSPFSPNNKKAYASQVRFIFIPEDCSTQHSCRDENESMIALHPHQRRRRRPADALLLLVIKSFAVGRRGQIENGLFHPHFPPTLSLPLLFVDYYEFV